MDQEILAWLAVGAAALALVKSGYDFWTKRKTDRLAIDEALAKAPEVQKQLELGNVGEAVKHLNVIIQSQAAHIDRINTDNERLRNRELALETEIAGHEKNSEECTRLVNQQTKIIAAQERRIEALERLTSGRTLDSETSGDVESDPTGP